MDEILKTVRYRFHQRMLEIYDEAAKFGYYPTRFRQMVEEKGGLETAEYLLGLNTVSDGFTRLWEEGRLDLSVEALVLQDEWQVLFTPEELDIARQRLKEACYLAS